MGKSIEKLRRMLCDELDNIAEQGEINPGLLELIDKLSHSIKSIDTILAMEDAGYSYNGSYMMGRGSSRYGSSYRSRNYDNGSSYRGRGGYSRDDGKEYMIKELEELMEDAPSDKEREIIHRAISQLDKD